MMKISPEKAVKPICWLIGKWKSVCANGEYPGVKPFKYTEEMEFQFIGQSLLRFVSKTYLKDEKCTPKHFESGFLKIVPGTNKLCFLLAHNFGLNSMEEGEVKGCEISLKSTEISRMTLQTGPICCQIDRYYKLCGDKLHMTLYMATAEKPLTKHLTVIYEKVC